MKNVSGKQQSKFYSEEAWPLLKASLILSVVNLSTSYLTDEIRILSGAYGRALSGVPEAQDKRKAAYHLAQGPFQTSPGSLVCPRKILSRSQGRRREKGSDHD